MPYVVITFSHGKTIKSVKTHVGNTSWETFNVVPKKVAEKKRSTGKASKKVKIKRFLE